MNQSTKDVPLGKVCLQTDPEKQSKFYDLDLL
jgi:hypothetical protein